MSNSRLLRALAIRVPQAFCALIVLATGPRLIAATTITVNSTADAGGTCFPGADCTLRQAIAKAISGDTIEFADGLKTVTLTSGELPIDKNLTITGPGANLLRVERSAASGKNFRIFNISPGATVIISGVSIINGYVTTSDGGGVFNNGTLTITYCNISGNSARNGGGISNSGPLTITNSTLSGNLATAHGAGGGAIYNVGMLAIANCTISGNYAPDVGGGGGLYSDTSKPDVVTITNSTISDNHAPQGGGGIYKFTGTVNMRNTIVALNTATVDPDIASSVTSQGYNFIGKSTGNITPTTGDQVGTSAAPKDPMLDDLGDNGGPTWTHALRSGSTAIEAGHSSGSNTDQRGLARPVVIPASAPVGDGSDIGAYEVQADQLPGCTSINRIVKNKNDSGTDSLRGVIAKVCAGSTITFAPNVTGAINLTSGQLLINKSLNIKGPGANVLSVQRDAAAGNLRILRIAPASVVVGLSGLTIANGSAPDDGTSSGGIANLGTLTISNCTVSGNSNSVTSGGGILNSGGRTLALINSTVSGNSTTAGGGGGIYNYASALTVTNSTISGNSATDTAFPIGSGGGILNSNGGTVVLTNSTVGSNTVDQQGGGIRSTSDSTLRSRNSIIALNTAPSNPDLSGALTSDGFNLIGESSGANITPVQFSDQKDVKAEDLKLGPLKDNGGPTWTHALLSGSVAIDKGYSSGLSTDQRGLPRPVDFASIAPASNGDDADIGAFEAQAPTPTPTPTPTAIPTPSPSPTPTLTPKPTPTPTPTPKPTATPTATPTSTATPTPRPTATPTAAATTLGNISTRLSVQTSDNVLIGGFIITGTQPKKVLIRAVGPSTKIPGALANPKLQLYAGQTLLEENDNWVDSPNKQAIIDTTIPPESDFESAIVRRLPPDPRGYTAIVRGVNSGTGIGLVEVYDLDRSVDSKLANISTRGLVQRGADVMIGGFIVLGQSSQKVLIRAIGASSGVPGALGDPRLDLRDKNGNLLQADDNWRTGGQEQEIIATGIPPGDDRESALIRTVPPGHYTAIVKGVGDAIGVALVEVYAIH